MRKMPLEWNLHSRNGVSGRNPGDAPSGTPLIAARGVSFVVGRQEVLTGIDMEVAPGEIVTLIGPNGAGKTTLVRVLLGIVEPTAGAVSRRAGLRIGYLPQRLEIDPALPLTVRRFLSLGRPGGRVEGGQALEEVGGGHLDQRMLQELSGGELQRVLLARALLREPELLILDEPVQGVDVTGQTMLYGLIGDIRRLRGCGVILISHDLHLVMSATDRVICINRHVCCSGHPEAVVKDPAYIRLFGEQAVSGLAIYTHAHDHTHEPPVQGAASHGPAEGGGEPIP